MGKFLLVVLLFAALVYTVFWVLGRRERLKKSEAPRRPHLPRRVVAPDDDEEFLRELDRRRRRAAREKKAQKPTDDEGRPDHGQPTPD